jgi:hypothetical protein
VEDDGLMMKNIGYCILFAVFSETLHLDIRLKINLKLEYHLNLLDLGPHGDGHE